MAEFRCPHHGLPITDLEIGCEVCQQEEQRRRENHRIGISMLQGKFGIKPTNEKEK